MGDVDKQLQASAHEEVQSPEGHGARDQITSVGEEPQELRFDTEEALDAFLFQAEGPGVDAEAFDVDKFKAGWEEDARASVEARAGSQRSEHDINRFQEEAAGNWESFYRRNTDKFFKDRHYLTKDFKPLGTHLESGAPCVVVEVGCGVGNAIQPLTRKHANCTAFGVDFAPKSIEILNNAKVDRCTGFVCDASSESLPNGIPPVDFATMVFMLSAVAPEKMQTAIMNVAERMKPGALLLFRDYCELDQTHLRFAESQRLGLNYYVRHDVS
mmetsp:Transcript_5084/g.9099  ORF Transcript_5084/g.9099 Transcript_5084/m.9099 type:complete len:271 (-) Transcript_5084:1127-1939(-)